MKKEYTDLVRRLRSGKEYWKRFSLLLFTTDIHRLMKNEPKPLSAAKLAKRIGVKPPVISSWLRGGENLTIDTMSKIALALDAVVYIHVAKKGVVVTWQEESQSGVHIQPNFSDRENRSFELGFGEIPHAVAKAGQPDAARRR